MPVMSIPMPAPRKAREPLNKPARKFASPPSKPGDRFGRLTLISEVPGQTGAPSNRRWNCLCGCGSTSTPAIGHLRTGHTTSCGCLQRSGPPSKSGDHFGRLTLISEVPGQTGSPSNRKWLCQCACGGTTSTPVLSSLRYGHTTSCGCLQREKAAEIGARSATHGLGRHTLYNTWARMVDRCNNPDSTNYHNYGGRNITVCRRWLEPANFIADMGHGYSPGLTLDRVDNSLGYSPANCRWATLKQQARNTRSNHLLSYRGRNVCLAEAVEIAGLKYTTAQSRLTTYGWSIQKALGPEFGPPI